MEQDAADVLIKKNQSFKIENVICKYELNSRRGKLLKMDENDYINLTRKMKEEKNENIESSVLSSDFFDMRCLLSHGWFRYLFKRGIKQTKNEKKIKQSCSIEPGKVLCYIPSILKQINIPLMEIFQCSIESDFAIRNHIEIYNKFSYPRIITNDTDFMVLLCDIDCEIEITIKNLDSKYERCVLNPKTFWNEVFGCQMKPDVIKMLCVLLGTDFNHYHPLSPIHIHDFESILELLNCNKFSDITDDKLKMYIYNTSIQYPENRYVKETILALNLYLNNIEGSLQPIDEYDLNFNE
jgi:hypothetical protein